MSIQNLRDLDLSTGIKLVWPKPKNSFVASALKNLRLPTRPLGTTPTPDPTVPPAIMSASSISHEKAQGVQDLTGESKSQDTDTATSSSLEVFPYDTLNVISEAGWFKTLRPSGLNRSSFPLQNREEPRERVRSLTPPYVGGAGDNSSVLQRIEQGQEGQESRTSSDWGVSNSHVQFWQSRRLEVIQPNAYFGSVCPQSVPVQPPPYTPSQSNVPSKTNQARVARTIWVGLSGTKPGFGTEDLLAFFEPCGTIEEVFLPTLAIPPYALVAFDDVLGAQHALSWSGSHFRGTRMQIKPKAITTLRTQSTYGAASPSWRGPVPSTRKSPPTARPMGLQSVPYDALRALTPATLPRPKRQNNSFDTYDSPLSIRHVRSISIPARQLNSVPSTPGHKSGKSSEALMPASSSVTDLLPGALYMSSSASEAYRIKFPPNTSTPRAQSPDRVGAGPSSDQGTLTQRVDSGMGIVLWPGGPSIQARADSEQPQVSETNAVSPGWSLLGTSKLATQGFGTTQTIVPGPPPPPPPFFTGGLDLAPAETSSGSSAEYLSIPSTSDRSFSPGLVVHHDGSTEVASTSPLPDPGPTTSDSGTQEHSTSSGSKDGSGESSSSLEKWSLTGYPPSSLVTQVNDLSSSNSANVSRSSDEGPEATESLTKGSNSTSSSGDKKAVLAEPSLPPISEALRVLPWDDDPRQPTGLFQEPPNFGPTVQRPPDFSRVQQPPKFSPIQQPPNLSSLIQQPYSLPSQPQEGTAYATPLLPPPMLYLPPGMGMMPGYPSPSGYPPPGTPFAPIFGPQGVTALHVSPYGLPYAPSSPLPMTSGGPYPYAALPPQYGPPSPMMMPPHMASPGPVPFPNSPYAYPSPYLHPSGSPSDDGPSG